MKNAKLSLALLLFISSSLFIHCTPDRGIATTTKEIIVQGKWSVNYYYNGQDNTAQYQGFTFSFSGAGSFTASNGVSSFSGTWGTMQDASRNEVLILNAANQTLSGLDAQWTVSTAAQQNIGLHTSTNNQLVLARE